MLYGALLKEVVAVISTKKYARTNALAYSSTGSVTKKEWLISWHLILLHLGLELFHPLLVSDLHVLDLLLRPLILSLKIADKFML